MAIAQVVTSGFGNGTFLGTVKDVVLRGFYIGEAVVVYVGGVIFKIRIPPAGVRFKFRVKKDPADVVDFSMDFISLLQGDTINTATVTAEQVTIDSSSISGKIVTFFVSGGEAGNIGTVTVKIVTNNSTPRTLKRSFKIEVKDL